MSDNIKRIRNWRQCPQCSDSKHTIKYRDEDYGIDGVNCQPCGIIWNVDWDSLIPDHNNLIDDGSGDEERKLTSSEMKVFKRKGLPKILNELNNSNIGRRFREDELNDMDYGQDY